MNKKYLKILIVFLTSMFLMSFISSETTSYHLFKIERSKDANEIFYDVNINSNNELSQNPISIYWIKQTNDGKKEPLTWIQKNHAYGIEYLNKNKETAKFQFVSYHKRQFIIEKDNNGLFKVFTNFENKKMIVNRIYIQIDGGTFWFPKISRVVLYYQDLQTKKQLIETIIP